MEKCNYQVIINYIRRFEEDNLFEIILTFSIFSLIWDKNFESHDN